MPLTSRIPNDGPMIWPAKIKRVFYDPHPALRHPNIMIPSSVKWPDLEPWVRLMFKAMYKEGNSVGLSACQVGWQVRLFIMNTDKERRSKKSEFVFWNPVALIFIGEPVLRHEGCLSLPKVFGMVPRHKEVLLEAMTPTGPIKTKFDGMEAHVVQHEWGHMNAECCWDRFVKEEAQDGPKLPGP
jgi:peptide deformylase